MRTHKITGRTVFEKRVPCDTTGDSEDSLRYASDMADDLWMRYDEKVVELQVLRNRQTRLLHELEEVRADRDRWIENSAGLKSKLASVRALTEKLRSTGTSKLATEAVELTRENEVSREVIGLLLIALAEAWSEEDLAWRASTQGGVNLLASIASGQLAVLPGPDNLVPRDWLAELDIDTLRRELSLSENEENEAGKELDLGHPIPRHRVPSTAVAPRARTDTFVGKPQFPRPTSASISGMIEVENEADTDTKQAASTSEFEVDVDDSPSTATGKDRLPTRGRSVEEPLPPPPPVTLSLSSPPPPLISND